MEKIECSICGCKRVDLTKHLKKYHNLTAGEYKSKYGGIVLSPDIEKKRKQTCKEKYGDENYKNKEAIALSNEIFEGGHSLKDPAVREKIKETHLKKYGTHFFNNRDKAKHTCLERYGVEHAAQIPRLIEKRINTLKDRYGKVFNVSEPHNKREIPKDFFSVFKSGESLDDMCARYNVSSPVITRWVKELDISREPPKTERVVLTPLEIIEMYIETCELEGKNLSFYEYGKIKGTRYCGKLKRLFNKGGKYHIFKEDLLNFYGNEKILCRLYEAVNGTK